MTEKQEALDVEASEEKVRVGGILEDAIKEVHTEIGGTLFELTEHWRAVLLAAEVVARDQEGEIPDELFDALEEAEEAVEEKLENYIRLYKNMKVQASGKEAVAQALEVSIGAILQEIERYKQEASSMRHQMDSVRDRGADVLEMLAREDDGWRKKLSKKEKEAGKQANPYFKGDSGTMWTQLNPPNLTLLVEPEEVPSKFHHVPKEEWINKSLLREILENPDHPDHEEVSSFATIDQTRGGRIR